MSAPIKIAVLDDYQGISEPKFRALDPAKYEVSFFRDTLRPYNHPDTPQDVKDKLVERLQPFAVICACPTRSPEFCVKIPPSLLPPSSSATPLCDEPAVKARGYQRGIVLCKQQVVG